MSLFFIPTIKWNRRYYVRTSCCGRIYELDPQIGKRIERGERVEIVDARTVMPNAAHTKLAQMEMAGRLRGIITQNIDGLHQKAGSINVQEIHGTTLLNHCVSCSK